MSNHSSPSGQRPYRSPVRTRATTNGKAPMYETARRRPRVTTHNGEGPLNGADHTSKSLESVPEDKPLRQPPEWYEGILIWTITVGLVIYLTCSVNDTNFRFLSPTPPIPTPPSSIPFTLLGFLRKAFRDTGY